jgi:hypothetical protein
MSTELDRDMDHDLDRLLAEMAGTSAPPPGAALMARILADAAREQPQPPLAYPPRAVPMPERGSINLTPPSGGGGWLVGLADFFGGRGALAGMMLATVAGLYLGVAQPATLNALTSLYTGTTAPLDNLDLLSGSDSLWTETAQ